MEDSLEYRRKLESLQKYVPFLNNMIRELTLKGNREAQLAKCRSLLSMITDDNRRLKIETLQRCEEVLISIYNKVLRKDGDEEPTKFSPAMDSPQSSLQSPSVAIENDSPESPVSTPMSPSPPMEVLRITPVTIPTEKVATTSSGLSPRVTEPKSNRTKIDVYSNVVLVPARKTDEDSTIVPDMSKPPITLDDLRHLEEDVQQKMIEYSYINKTDEELQEEKKQIELRLRMVEMRMAHEGIEEVEQEPEQSKKLELPTKLIKNPVELKEIDMFEGALSQIDSDILEKKKMTERRTSVDSQRDKTEGKKAGAVIKPATLVYEHVPLKRLADKYNPKPKPRVVEPKKLDSEVSKDSFSAPLQAPVFKPATTVPVTSPLLPTPIVEKSILKKIQPPRFAPTVELPPEPAPNPFPFQTFGNTVPTFEQNHVPQYPLLLEPVQQQPTFEATQVYQNRLFIESTPSDPRLRNKLINFYPQTSVQNSYGYQDTNTIDNFGYQDHNIVDNFGYQEPKSYDNFGYQEQNNPRNYREYKLLKERQERQAKSAMEAKLAEEREARIAREKRQEAIKDRNMRDPRLKAREALERTRTIADSEPITSVDKLSTSSSESKFDKIYSATNKPHNNEEVFTSPLDSLYNPGDKKKTGIGYGVQSFKIPKKPKPVPLKTDAKPAESPKVDEPKVEKSKRIEESKVQKPKKVVESKAKKIKAKKTKAVVEQVKSSATASRRRRTIVESSSDSDEEFQGVGPPPPLFVANPKLIDGIDISRIQVVMTSIDEPKDTSLETVDIDQFVSAYDKEEELRKSTEPEKVENSAEPTDQNILAHFFENLLKSQNKKDKKTALFSLIETFSDSFEDREINKIRKIINIDEGDDEERSDEEKDPTNTSAVQGPVVGSTTEDNAEEASLSAKKNALAEIREKETQVNVVSKSTKDVDGPSSEEEEEEPALKPKKKHKKELDMLHEDIKDMFIRDGVLTATGKRMCTILKDEPESIIPTSPRKIRKRGRSKRPNNLDAAMKDMRVVISKIPEDMLRRQTRSMDYTDNDSVRSGSTLSKYDSESEDSSIESDATDKKSVETEKPKRKRKALKWASGIITKPKKRKQTRDIEPTPSPVPSSIDDVSSHFDDDMESLIEPDKHYYYDYAKKTKLNCKLCSYSGHLLTSHYLKTHPHTEVLSCRLSPEAALLAIEDFKTKDWKLEKIDTTRLNKQQYSCRVCGYSKELVPGLFYEHVTTHTGEYWHQCEMCSYSIGSSKALRMHVAITHPGEEKKIYRCNYESSVILAYMCGDCNYVQLKEKNLTAHVNTYHSLHKPRIYKINISSVIDPSLMKLCNEVEVPIKVIKGTKPGPKSKKRKLAGNVKSNIAENKQVELKPKRRKQRTTELGSLLELEDTDSYSFKTRKTLNQLIAKDSPDDAETIISLSSRSNRAAKDKATAKLKSLIDNVESKDSSLKKDTKKIKKNNIADETTVTTEDANMTHEDNSVNLTIDEFSDLSDDPSNEPDLNIFTCKMDIEDAQEIEQDRIKKMDELTKTIASRSVNLDFIQQISNRLKQEYKLEPEEVILKADPDDAVNQTNLEEVTIKKPSYVEDVDIEPSAQTSFGQDKPNTMMSSIIEKLQGKMNETPSVTIEGYIKVSKVSDVVTYSCLVDCDFTTEDKLLFMQHFELSHHQAVSGSGACDQCGVVVDTQMDGVKNVFDHLYLSHSDFISCGRMLKMRRLSGDMLSAKLKDEEEEEVKDEEKEDEEAKEEDMIPEDDNPFSFKISNVISLATESVENSDDSDPLALSKDVPPLTPITKQSTTIVEAKLTKVEIDRPRKSPKAFQKFLELPGDLYKCPNYFCMFSNNVRALLDNHIMNHHKITGMIACVYCDMKTPWDHVGMHINVRHANSKFACAYCLYRAITSDYVYLHQMQCHPNQANKIMIVPVQFGPRFAIAEQKPDKGIVEPYRCRCKINPVTNLTETYDYLFETEFVHHLLNAHPTEAILPCAYSGCFHRLPATMMLDHWVKYHGIAEYQCGKCKTSSASLVNMIMHCAVSHCYAVPDILIRKIDPIRLPKDRELGFSAEAFQLAAHVDKIPQFILKDKKVVYVQVKSTLKPAEEPPTHSSSVKNSSLMLQPQVPTSPTTLKVLNSNVKLLVASKSNSNEKVYLLPVKRSPNKVVVQNSPTKANVESHREPVRFGGITLYPSDDTAVEVVQPTELEPQQSPNDDDDLLQSTIQSILDQEEEKEDEQSGNVPPLVFLSSKNDSQSPIVCDDITSDLPYLNMVDDQLLIDDPMSITPTLNVNLPDHTEETETSRLNSQTDELNNSRMSDDELENVDKKVRGLAGHDLLRCELCSQTFPHLMDFKLHLNTSATCKHLGPKGYKCIHCMRSFKHVQGLMEHILCHGLPRFSCSLCNEKLYNTGVVKHHMRSKHNVSQLTIVLQKTGNDTNMESNFIVKPNQLSTPTTALKEKEAVIESPTPVSDEIISYNPDQIETIPYRMIFSQNVKCGLCNYQTKVRVNIIRHLQLHQNDKWVPDNAPINPVPCLEKNEKMFDKMFNLAASSIPTASGSRMGGPSKKVEKSYPEFVPSHRRYVCSAQGCSYLCPEESNLKHHIVALHNDEKIFTCAHCKIQLAPTEIENVIKHFKLHGLNLYKCHYCDFIHHFKHKIERHLEDEHKEEPVQVDTIRSMDAEPVDVSHQEELQPIPMIGPKSKPWSCCMCKTKFQIQSEIQAHIVKKHNIDAQYKCTLCTHRSDDIACWTKHFADMHVGQNVDIIHAYQKVEEETPKVDLGIVPFDTTPLWQRDKPRVRHIRGILFEDTQPVKVARKSKGQPSPKTTPIKSQESRIETEPISNLSDTIDSVARGAGKPKRTGKKQVVSKQLLVTSPSKVKIEPIITKDTGNESSDEDVIEITPPYKVIVLHSDDESDSESSISAKKQTSPKKLNIITTKEEIMTEKYTKENLIHKFGPLGKPNSKQLICPKCSQFKSKRVPDFIFHLYREFRVYRYSCEVCKDHSITYKYMLDHLKVHPEYDEKVIKTFPADVMLETWIQMVIRHQSSMILDNTTLFTKTPVTKPTEFRCLFCSEEFMTANESYEHMFYHWSMMPYQCKNCPTEFYTILEYQYHHKSKHSSMSFQSMSTGPTVSQALQAVETPQKMRQQSEEEPVAVKAEQPVDPLINVVSPQPTEKTKESETNNAAVAGDIDSGSYACNSCAFLADDLEIMNHIKIHKKHKLNNFHIVSKTADGPSFGCNICDEVFTEYKLRLHFMEKHPDATYSPYQFKCGLCKAHFLTGTGVRGHIAKVHDFTSRVFWMVDKVPQKYMMKPKLKAYNCSICGLTIRSTKCGEFRDHLLNHLKLYRCDYCSKRLPRLDDIYAHQKVDHPLIQASHTFLKESIVLLVNAINAAESPQDNVDIKRISCKSTSLPSNKIQQGVSFYGLPEPKFQLERLKTTYEVDGVQVKSSVAKMKQSIDIDPYVDMTDCTVEDWEAFSVRWGSNQD